MNTINNTIDLNRMLPYQKCKKFLLDLIFCALILLLLALALILFLLSHLVVGRSGLGASLSLITLGVAPTPSLPFTDSIVTLQQNVIQWLDRPKSILVFTDPAATYNNYFIQHLWFIVLIITDGIISIFFVITGYQILFAGFTERYREALEDLPNLVFAAIGANMSLLFAQFWVDINNSLCSVIVVQAHTQSHPMAGLGSMNGTLSLITLPFLLVFILLLILLGVQLTGRLGIIVLLTVLLAALFALLMKSRTQRLGQAGLMAYVTAVLLQCLQLSCITLGEKVLLPFLIGNSGLTGSVVPVVMLLASIALLWITLRLPAMLRQWALSPISDSGHAARSFLLIAGARLFSF